VILESISGFVILIFYKNSQEDPEDGIEESRNTSDLYLKSD